MRLIAVVFAAVEREIGTLGNAPGLPDRHASPLRIEAEAAAFIQQASPLRRQKQQRHQVFEHRARPAGQAPVAVLLQLSAAEPPPVPQRHVALGDGKVACQHGLARHQVVAAARAAALRRVIRNIKQLAHRIIKRRKIHRREQGVDATGQRFVALLPGEGLRHAQPRPAVAAVHGGQKGRVQRLQRAGIVPVVKVAAAAGQALHAADEPREKGQRFVGGDDPDIAGRDSGRRSQPHIGGRRAVRRPLRRLVLDVVRRKKMLLLGAEFRKIAPGVRRAGRKPVPVGPAQAFGPEGGQAERGQRRRGEQPQKPRRAADHRGRSQQADKPQCGGHGHGAQRRGETAFVLLGLGGGLPLQHFLMGDQHAPEGGDGGGETDPGLPGQQPQAHQTLNDRTADAGEQPRVAPQARRGGGAPGAFNETGYQSAQQRQQRRPGRQAQPVKAQEKARQDRQQRHRGEQAPAQTVEQPPAVDRAQLPSPVKEPGAVLPVAAHPAVQALVVGQRPGGKAVGKAGVTQKAAAQEGTLQRVMREDGVRRDALCGAGQKGMNIQDALAGKAAAVEGVHIEFPAEAAIGIAAARPGEDQSKIRGVGAVELGCQPGMDEPVARRHHALFGVDVGAVHRVEHRADQRERGAGLHARVAVEREDVACARQRVALPGDGEGGGFVSYQPRQIQQRPALALFAAPALAVKAARTGKEIEAAAIAPVERGDRFAGGAQQPGVRLRFLRVGGGQVGQNAILQVLPGFAVCQAEFLQPPAELFGALRVRQQRREDAERFSLRRHALRQIHPGQPPGRDQAQQHQVHQALDKLRHGKQQQGSGPDAARGKGQQQAQKQARQHDGGNIDPGARVRRLVKKEKAEVPALLLCLADQTAGQQMLLRALRAGQRLQPFEIAPAALPVHAGVDVSGIFTKRRVAEIDRAQQLLRIRAGEPAQRGKQGLEGLALGR